MSHGDADRNFWVKTVVGVISMAMIAGCVYKYGDKMDWIAWTILAVVFVLIVLSIMLPAKVYIEFLKALPATLSALPSNIFKKKIVVEEPPKPDNQEQPNGK